MQIITSKQFNLDWRDLLKGAVVAAFTAGATALGNVIDVWYNSDSLSIYNINYQIVFKTMIVVFVGYLAKNFVSPSKVITKVQPPETVEEVADKIKDNV